jgi:uroporphyrinogen-III synthase
MSEEPTGSLTGRRIVVTRAAGQAGGTEALVRAAGAIPIAVPLIEIVDEADGLATLQRTDLGAFDWVVVTSPNGADRLAPLLTSGSPRVAAVGTATAAALPRCDLLPGDQSAAGLVAEFPAGPGAVLVVQAVDAAPTMVAGLVAKGWTVSAISPYRSRAVTPPGELVTAALAADAVLFASGSAARAWAAAFGPSTPPVVVAIGEQTAAACEATGLKVTLVAADHSVYGMLVTLDRYYAANN